MRLFCAKIKLTFSVRTNNKNKSVNYKIATQKAITICVRYKKLTCIVIMDIKYVVLKTPICANSFYTLISRVVYCTRLI